MSNPKKVVALKAGTQNAGPSQFHSLSGDGNLLVVYDNSILAGDGRTWNVDKKEKTTGVEVSEAIIHMPDIYPGTLTGDYRLTFGFSRIVQGKLCSLGVVWYGPFGSPVPSVGLIVFDNTVDLSTPLPIFYPITDFTNNDFPNSAYNTTNYSGVQEFETDGTYVYIRDGVQVRKYAITGGSAIEVLPMPNVWSGASFENWCFAPDGQNIYMCSSGDPAHGLGGVAFGPLGTTLPNSPPWLDLTATPPTTDVRNQEIMNGICVDHSTGHVFVQWDNGQSGLPIFVDEYTSQAQFVTRWIPRTAYAPTPSVHFPWTLPGYGTGTEWQTQGTTFGGPMCAGNGILYMNFDLFWSIAPTTQLVAHTTASSTSLTWTPSSWTLDSSIGNAYIISGGFGSTVTDFYNIIGTGTFSFSSIYAGFEIIVGVQGPGRLFEGIGFIDNVGNCVVHFVGDWTITGASSTEAISITVRDTSNTTLPMLTARLDVLLENQSTQQRLEDAIWRFDTTTWDTTRSGESELWTRANRSPAEQAITYTITPIAALTLNGRSHGPAVPGSAKFQKMRQSKTKVIINSR